MRVSAQNGPGPLDTYWALSVDALLGALHARPDGLSEAEAAERLAVWGANEIRESAHFSRLQTLWNQMRSPLLLLLVFAAVVSVLSGEWPDAVIVFLIVGLTVGIGYQREHQAEMAIAMLRARIKTRSTVLRAGHPTKIPVADIVPGDIVLLQAGSLVPADAVVLESTDCYVSQAVLTGESFPVFKRPGLVDRESPVAGRSNSVFLGTHVRSGTARCLVVATGASTQFGAIAQRLATQRADSEFERALNRLGYLLTSVMLVMVLLVFAAHMLMGRPALETLLFALALAVGLSPELLPVILNVNLARAATTMAQEGVLVRHLGAIENLGSMDILCCDKTGTLTAGVIELLGAYDPQGQPSEAVLLRGALNAAFETGVPSPLDEAILSTLRPPVGAYEKLAEIPFDFIRKCVSVVVQGPEGIELISKGAFLEVIERCDRLPDGTPLNDAVREELTRQLAAWNAEGIRILACAAKILPTAANDFRHEESHTTFLGFLAFLDLPKPDAARTLASRAALGVSTKLITGDSHGVALHVAKEVGLANTTSLTGADLDRMSDESLWQAAERTGLFAEVNPHQKERIIRALQKMGHVVGFLGDGINDAPAMHAADTSLSVEQAADVAREAADFVLLERDLDVVRRGVEAGRKTFANTMKYLLTTSSANLGNMLRMAVASLFLPFLPLLAGQILLNNLLSDIPALGMAGDRVDPEWVERPTRWHTAAVARFMVAFGLLSSFFDVLTFWLLMAVFSASPTLFRTGWFIESLLTELVIALVVRTRRPFFRSRPGRLLFWSTQAVIALTFLLPFLPGSAWLGFAPPPGSLLASLVLLTLGYVAAAECLKAWFFRRDPHPEL